MASLLFSVEASSRSGWQYWRPSDCGIVELGTVRGEEVALPAHFHEEDQVTFVLSGRRIFVIGGKLIEVPPGQGTHIPAGIPHCSLSASSEVIAINIYIAPHSYAASHLIAALSRFWRSKGNIDWSELAFIVEEHRCVANVASVDIGRGNICAQSWETVGQAAQLAGMSRDLIERNPFGVLVIHCAEGLDANHLPFGLDKKGGALGVLYAHVARANPVWRNVTDGDDVLVVFQAGHAYVSPNWYPSKQEFHKQVPTWNYMVAHAHGRIAVHDNERHVRSIVARLTKTHEATQPEPWKMSDSSREFIDAMVKAVVGIEIHITRLIGKSKLSQNREARDIRSAGLALKAQGNDAIGDAMFTFPEGVIRPTNAR